MSLNPITIPIQLRAKNQRTQENAKKFYLLLLAIVIYWNCWIIENFELLIWRLFHFLLLFSCLLSLTDHWYNKYFIHNLASNLSLFFGLFKRYIIINSSIISSLYCLIFYIAGRNHFTFYLQKMWNVILNFDKRISK